MLAESHAGVIAERFALGRPASFVGPVASGRLGEIWRLVTDQGAFAVKEATVPVSAAAADCDAQYQDVVRAGGVPMPAVVRSVAGSVLADVDGFPVRVYEWVDVLPRERGLDPGAVGRVLAAIHSVHVPTTAPLDPWYVEPVGADRWAGLLSRLSAARAPFTERLAAVIPAVVETESVATTPGGPLAVCHRDLWADNVLRSPSGGLLVLDWENCGPASQNQELGVVLFEFGLADPARMRALFAAYAEAGGRGRLSGRADLTMLIAQTGNIARIGCERWLAATAEESRADNADWVGEFLDEPVTLDTIDLILDSVHGS